MNVVERIITIAIASITNFLTRCLPFAIFNDKKTKALPFVDGVGKFLPPAIMAMLVVYCFRNVNFSAQPYGLPELIASALTIAVHLWRKNMFLSLFTGTISYILLLNFVF
ncbi:MAG: AzlD domain-containing protein [Lactobacillus sp.]|jgi:branched-subunit amino acid transport protein AzlD|nr:AzlD domain-containing protein [Lactobacillus sp.]